MINYTDHYLGAAPQDAVEADSRSVDVVAWSPGEGIQSPMCGRFPVIAGLGWIVDCGCAARGHAAAMLPTRLVRHSHRRKCIRSLTGQERNAGYRIPANQSAARQRN